MKVLEALAGVDRIGWLEHHPAERARFSSSGHTHRFQVQSQVGRGTCGGQPINASLSHWLFHSLFLSLKLIFKIAKRKKKNSLKVFEDNSECIMGYLEIKLERKSFGLDEGKGSNHSCKIRH